MATEQSVERRDALVGRLFEAFLGCSNLLTVHLGLRLGLYRTLEDHGPLTSVQLAERMGLHERYVREWLEQQASTGILDVSDAEAEPTARLYHLPEGHAEVLLDRNSLSYLGPMSHFVPSIASVMPHLLDAFRSGGGVPWSAYGADAREGQAEMNRPVYLNLLAREWLPSLPGVHERLQADPPSRVADIACGAGWSSIAIAAEYPNALVDGFDLDEPSIKLAQANAESYGVSDRVSFHVNDAGSAQLSGQYDLVIICEALHDMSDPVGVLRVVRTLLAENGTALVMDEKVADKFTAPGDELERLFYGYSVLCCLPAGMSEQPSAATGTVMRPPTLRRYAQEAGFGDIEILPIEHDFFRLYRLVGAGA